MADVRLYEALIQESELALRRFMGGNEERLDPDRESQDERPDAKARFEELFVLQDLISCALSRLESRLAEVVRLSFLKQKDDSDIAEQLAITEREVGTLRTEALRKLKAIIKVLDPPC